VLEAYRAETDFIGALDGDPDDEVTSNEASIVGYVGRDPQIRYTADGALVVSLSLATHRWHGENGELVRTTDWHRVVAFDAAADLCEHLRSGDLIRASGRLHTRTWRDRLGAYHERTEIIVAEITRVRRRPTQLGLGMASSRVLAHGVA
jgi:single-strand DNA-binding protein